MVDVVVSHFRDVYKAFYITLLQPCKSAKYGEARNGRIDELALTVRFHFNQPRIRLRASEAEGDAPRFVVDLEDMNFKVLPRLDDLRGVRNRLPRQFRYMDEAVGAAKIDERAEVTHAGHSPLANGTLLQFGQQGLPLFDAHVLRGCSLREDGTLSAPVDFNDLELEFLSDKGIKGLELVIAIALGEFTVLRGELREGNEGLDATSFDEDAAAIVANDPAVDEFLGVLFFFELPPTAFGLGTIVREHVLAGVIGSYKSGDNRITGLEGAGLIFREASHFAVGYYTFAFRADIDEEAFIIDVDNSTLDGFAPPQRGHFAPLCGQKATHFAVFRP